MHFGYVNHLWLKRYAEYKAEGLDGVLSHAENTLNISDENIFQEYIKLLKIYNLKTDSILILEKNALDKGYGDTLKEMQELNLIPEKPYKLVPFDKESRIRGLLFGFTTYVVGNRRWSYSKAWKNSQIKKTQKFLTEMKSKKASDTCVIVCNGPSLNKVKIETLYGHDLIVSNNIFYNKEILDKAKFLTVVNYLVAEQSAQELNDIKGIYKILPYWLRYCINENDNTFFVNAKGFPVFSTDIHENISWRHTVTFFNLQLAYGLGYKKVLLIGCDHIYHQPKNINEQDIIQDEEPDTNHFDARYFKGKKWQAADVNNMEEMYKLSKIAFENDNREIVNCTDGGHLELFRRSSLDIELPVLSTNTHDLKQPDPPLAGPFNREENVNIDETILIRDYVGKKSNGVMIDVGAHHGYASKPFLKKNWKIFAFEPDPNNRKILKSQFNKQPNISIFKNAVSDVTGDNVPFYASDESTGISGLSAFREDHKEICHVRTIILKDFCEKHQITNIDFLKIDTEGYDLMVLKGVPWDKFHPNIIECEFEDLKTENLGYNFNDIAGFLVEKGYEVYVSEWHPIIRYGITHDWHQLKKYPCRLSTNTAWGNLLAFKEKPDEEVLVELIRNQLVRPKSDIFTRLRKIFG
jgi:FkbM family methyltransferase